MSSSTEDRYASIERAYGEGRFIDALERAELLLEELQKREASPEREIFQSRLSLLTGHIHLYGLAQPEEARAFYQAVTSNTAPPTLVDLATAGLKRCEQLSTTGAAPTQLPSETDVQATNNEDMSSQSDLVTSENPNLPATPWLNRLTEPQEALQALQAAWDELPASLPATVNETPVVTQATPATPWTMSTTSKVSIISAEPGFPDDGPRADEGQESTPENEMTKELHAEVELVDEQDSSSPGPDYSLGNLVVELAPSPDEPPSENRPQQPQERGQSWRRFFKLKRP